MDRGGKRRLARAVIVAIAHAPHLASDQRTAIRALLFIYVNSVLSVLCDLCVETPSLRNRGLPVHHPVALAYVSKSVQNSPAPILPGKASHATRNDCCILDSRLGSAARGGDRKRNLDARSARAIGENLMDTRRLDGALAEGFRQGNAVHLHTLERQP